MTAIIMLRPLRRESRGLSLIEILVALTISALLLLGLTQIFIGSKLAYTVQAGMSRSQENARFVFSFLEDNLRMAGYYGCGNEADASLQFYNHIIAAPADDPTALVRFNRPVEGFEYGNCDSTGCPDTDNSDVSAGVLADWSPSLATTSNILLADQPVKGSDILVLRVLNATGAPVVSTAAAVAFNPASGTFNLAAVPNEPDFVKEGGVYAATNCRPRVDIFRASATSAGTTLIGGFADNALRNPNGTGPTDTWGFTNAEGEFKQPPLGTPPSTLNAEVHKANFLAIFVGMGSDGNPALKVRHYSSVAGGALPGLTIEEIADGVESMQVRYGVDADGDGIADSFVDASDLTTAGATPAQIDTAWRRVVSVRIALLMRSNDIASVPADSSGNVFTVGIAKMTRPADGRFRDVYETTIALRNRLTNF